MPFTQKKMMVSMTTFYKPSKPNNVFITPQIFTIFIPHYSIVVGYYDFMLVIHVSVHLSLHPSVVHPSVFLFPDDNLSKY